MTETLLLTAEHIRDVGIIEKECFSEPWSEGSLALLCMGDNFGIVVVDEVRVVAYGGMTCVLDEGSVTNVAVLPTHRRMGLGRKVVRALADEAERRGIKNIFLEVRESNVAAETLYLSEGFVCCGVRKGFYRHPSEHAIQMIKNLTDKK